MDLKLAPDKTELSSLIAALEKRFLAHPERHTGMGWPEVLGRIQASGTALAALWRMEATGGEPDVIGRADSGACIFCDCSPETPSGRLSLCYDKPALDARKANKPSGDVLSMAAELGIELLDEAGYLRLQALGEFDRKTSSWLLTPPGQRKLGGAIFGDRRYNRVFIYHNGADSYYSSRGFRGTLTV